LTQVDRYAADGLRTLGFATRTLDRYPAETAGWETDLDFVGMIGLSDPVRPEARAAVEEAYQAGVSTVMVTGDHTATAGAVARAVGIRNVDVVHGSVLSEVGLDGAAELTDVVAFARVDPVDKVAIVRAHQANGSLVAMTGDGVNDAPALRNADIGVAMGSGTDVARESSDLVLVDDNYATIVAAIREGRRIFGNLRNVVHYLLSANASEVIYMVVGFLAFGFLGQPLLAVQLLWINLLSDALPALALGLDEPSHDLMKDPPGAGRDILSRNNLALLLGQGVILAAATVTTMLVGHYVLDLVFEVTRTMAFTTLVLAQLVHAINVRSAGDRLSAPQASLIGAILVSLLMQLAVIYLPVGNSVFDTAALGPTEWLWILIPSAASFGLIRLMNRAASRRGGSARTRLRR
jgi:Ca2+-transporting ATPase